MTLREELGDELCDYCDYNDGTCEGDCDGCDDAYENYKQQKGIELMNDQNRQESAAKIHVDIDTEDIEAEIVCAFARHIDQTVQNTISRIVAEGYAQKIKDLAASIMEEKIAAAVDSFMKEKITIGGGWHQEVQELTRTEYLNQTISKRLEEKFDIKNLSERVKEQISHEIQSRMSKVRDEANRQIKNTFDEAARANLTDTIVSMLMSNETYQRLSGSMQNLIGSSK